MLHAQALLSPNDWVVVTLLGLAWFSLDVAVIVVNVERDELGMFMAYLTNQVWSFGVFTKALLACSLVLNYREKELFALSWLSTAAFILLGILQLGVLFAFFWLLLSDDKILNDMITPATNSTQPGQELATSDGVTMGTIVFWNHMRHVSPVILHLAGVLSLRGYISRTLSAPGALLREKTLSVLLLVLPIVAGLSHSAIFDDKQLYKYGDEEIGSKCQLAFGLSAVVGTVYFMRGVFYSYADHPDTADAGPKSVLQFYIPTRLESIKMEGGTQLESLNAKSPPIPVNSPTPDKSDMYRKN